MEERWCLGGAKLITDLVPKSETVCEGGLNGVTLCVGLYLGICTALRMGPGGVLHPMPDHRSCSVVLLSTSQFRFDRVIVPE